MGPDQGLGQVAVSVSWFALFVAGLISVLVLVIAFGVATLYAMDAEGRGGAQFGMSAVAGLCAAAGLVVTIALAIIKAVS